MKVLQDQEIFLFAKTQFSVLTNQLTLHSVEVNKGRVSNHWGYPFYFQYLSYYWYTLIHTVVSHIQDFSIMMKTHRDKFKESNQVLYYQKYIVGGRNQLRNVSSLETSITKHAKQIKKILICVPPKLLWKYFVSTSLNIYVVIKECRFMQSIHQYIKIYFINLRSTTDSLHISLQAQILYSNPFI